MLYYVISIFSIFAIVSCSSSTEPEILKPSSEYFPLSIGNYWEYEESYSSEDSSNTITFKSTITRTERIGGFNWYKIESVRENETSKRHLMIEKDSVYELQYNFQNPIRSLQYIVPKELTETFPSIFGGDVGINKKVEKLDTTIQTNIGVFTNCYRFQYSTSSWTEKEIFVYGIGIVEKHLTVYNVSTGKTSQRISKIKNAKISSN